MKAYASLDSTNDENDNWDSNFEGDLVTIRGPHKPMEADTHELETIRPYRIKPTVITQDIKPAVAPKIISRKASASMPPPRPKSPIKAHAENKFHLPQKSATLFKESSMDDYSDIFVDTDIAFNRRLNIIKVSLIFKPFLDNN